MKIPEIFKNETQFQEYANKHLREKKIMYYHRQNGQSKKKAGQNYIEINNVKFRFWDLMIFQSDGKVFFVELKQPNGTTNKEQENFGVWAGLSGYNAYVCRNWEEFLLVLSAEGIK